MNKKEVTLKIDDDSKFIIKYQKPFKQQQSHTPPPQLSSKNFVNDNKKRFHCLTTTSSSSSSSSQLRKVQNKSSDSDSILPIYSNSKLALLTMEDFTEKRKEIYCNGFGINIQNRLMSFFKSAEIEQPRPFKQFEPIVYPIYIKEHRYIPTRITNAAYWNFVSRLDDLSDQEIRINRQKLDWNHLSAYYAFDVHDVQNYQEFIKYEFFLNNENTSNLVKRNVGSAMICGDSSSKSYYDKLQLLESMSKRDFNRNIHWVFLNFKNDVIMKKIKRLYCKELNDTEYYNIDYIAKILYDDFNIPKLSSFKL